ncbi:hypothetical protein [Paraburkholderia gardini]|uniref:Uncharacterized protein n=1 Tax=Paraburkholderia gardini TaxID=2823469 RepID=A0ABM8TYP5_9BURK|nr:hypothetical protein [Paraburkholderia gardini]CAG4889007.1 hypothetical protein R54767_00623 [Paraburkholderia gardini]CAG4896559.1 hypothetical protein R69919_02202 [Paraburkholderia gardini]
MAQARQYQLRMKVSAELAVILRGDPAANAHAALHDVLCGYDATLKCQYDAFADYVSEAEKMGVEKYPLYEWTRATIKTPAKKPRYLQSFTVYVDGEEIYDGDVADALHEALSALAGADGIVSVMKFDTNPANNPQPPARER